jgi:hypothetical protein
LTSRGGFQKVGTAANSGDQLALSFALEGVNVVSNNGTIVDAPMAGFGDFNSLFDEYKILKVVMEVRFSSVQTVAGKSAPLIHICKDMNDALPISIDAIQQYSNSQRFQLSSIFTAVPPTYDNITVLSSLMPTIFKI